MKRRLVRFRLDRPETMHAAHVVDAVHVDLPWRTSATVGVDAAILQWLLHRQSRAVVIRLRRPC
jgi:hypothetical protein